MTHAISIDKWTQVREKIHARWNKLAEADIDRIDGNHDLFIATLQERYGCTEKKAEDQLRRFIKAVTRKSRTSILYGHGWGVNPSHDPSRKT